MRNKSAKIQIIGIFFSIAIAFACWYALTHFWIHSTYILPNPQSVLIKLYKLFYTGVIWPHLQTTLIEIILGICIAIPTAFLLGYAFAKSRLLYTAISPMIVFLQSIPVIAIAPILIIWLGTGIESKAVIVASTIFFPLFIHAVSGFSQINPNHQDLFKLLNASKIDQFLHLELQSALPHLFNGLKVAAVFSVIGAVVGEFVGSRQGIGFLISLSGSLFDAPLRYAALFILGTISIVLYGSVHLLEARLITWKIKEDN